MTKRHTLMLEPKVIEDLRFQAKLESRTMSDLVALLIKNARYGDGSRSGGVRREKTLEPQPDS